MWGKLGHSIAVRIVAAIVLLYAAYELSRQFVVIADDAYVTTDTAALAPQVAGVLQVLHVEQNQQVSAGAPLFALDPAPFRIAVQEAQAGLQVAQAQLQVAQRAAAAAKDEIAGLQADLGDAQKQLGRIGALAVRGDAARAQLDNVTRDRDSAASALAAAQAKVAVAEEQIAVRQAQLSQARAQLDRAQWALAQTMVAAPFDGVVAPFAARPGDYVEAGKPVLALLSDAGWRITANLKEADLDGLWPGGPVSFTLSTSPWTLREGSIRSIGRGVARLPGADGVLPYVPPTTDWIALPQRFPVEIDIGETAGNERLFMGADARVLVFY